MTTTFILYKMQYAYLKPHSNKFTKDKINWKSQWHDILLFSFSCVHGERESRNALLSETGRLIQGRGSALYNPQKAQSCYRRRPALLLRQTGTECRTPAGRSPPLEQPTWRTPETKHWVWYPVTWPLYFPLWELHVRPAAAVTGKPVAHPEPGQSLISLIMITLSEDVWTEIGKPGGWAFHSLAWLSNG